MFIFVEEISSLTYWFENKINPLVIMNGGKYKDISWDGGVGHPVGLITQRQQFESVSRNKGGSN